MSVSLQFFGVAGYKVVTTDGVHVVIDPFLEKNPFCSTGVDDLGRVDLLLLTHNAFDHFGDAPEVIKRYNCRVICAADVLHHLVRYHSVDADLIRPTIWGMSVEECGVFVRPVESRHGSFCRPPDGQLLSGPAMGFVVDAGEDIRIYHPGDTALFSDMKLIGRFCQPTVGLIHVTLPEGEGISLPHQESYKSGELTPEEALTASEWLGLREVVVSHYVDPKCADVTAFVKLIEENRQDGLYAPNTVVLAPGETHTW